MDTLTVVFLVYTFLAFYLLFLFCLIYVQNKSRMYEIPLVTKQYALSIVVPCYNAEKQIGETIQTLLNSDYKGLKKIIVVDDCSTDNSYKIAKKFEKKHPGLVLVVQTPKNTGRAAGSKNYGARFVKTDLIGFTDDDSRPKPNAIRGMIGFFDDSTVGAVTSRILVLNREKFIARLQAIEYKVIAFTRKLLGFVGAIYVTNGPLSIYRKTAFDKVHGFDIKNLTEDIEITWHMVAEGYKVHMALSSSVYSIVPDNAKAWFRQRIRWNVGGMQTINKYKMAFLKVGMLGSFILPFFVLSWVLGIIGLAVLVYRIGRIFIIRYLSTKLSIETQTAILTLREINLTPSILLFFGVVLFILGFVFTLLALAYSREKEFKNHGIFSILMYTFVYLLVYPVLLIVSLWEFIRGKQSW